MNTGSTNPQSCPLGRGRVVELYRSRRARLVQSYSLSDPKPFKILRVPDDAVISTFASRDNALRAFDAWYRSGAYVK